MHPMNLTLRTLSSQYSFFPWQTRLAFEARYIAPNSKKTEQGKKSSSRGRGSDWEDEISRDERRSRASSSCDEGRRTRESSVESFSRELEKERLIQRKSSPGGIFSSRKSSTRKNDRREQHYQQQSLARDKLGSFKRSDVYTQPYTNEPSSSHDPTRASPSGRKSKGNKFSRAESSPKLLPSERSKKIRREAADVSPHILQAAPGGSGNRKGLEGNLEDEIDGDNSDEEEQDIRILTKSQSEAQAVGYDQKQQLDSAADSNPQKSNLEGVAFDSDLDEKQMLLNVEQNIANLEKSMSMQEKIASMAKGHKSKDSSPETPRKR